MKLTVMRRVLHRFSATEKGLLVAIIVAGIGLSLLSPVFLTAVNLLNVSRQMALVGILGVGMAYCIISGEFDLSVGSTLGLTAMVSALTVIGGGGPILGIIVGLVTGMAIGVVNGVLTTRVNIPSFIVTLGTLLIGRGIVLAVTAGYPVPLYGMGVPEWFLYLGQGRPWGIPMQAIFMVIVLLIGNLVLSRTKIGYHMYAIGGGARAAHLHGIAVARIKIYAFILSGFLAAIAGILSIAFVESSGARLGTGMELTVIAAVVIGGVSIQGGQGSILGVFLGALVMALILNALALLGISAYYQRVVIGLVIISSVAVNTIRMRAAYLKG